MTTSTRDKIIDYVAYNGRARVHDLSKFLQVSTVAIHRQLKKLLEEGVVVRLGRPPLVFYTFPSGGERTLRSSETEKLSESTQQIIANNFLSITADGTLLHGMQGFLHWMDVYRKGQLLTASAKEYEEVVQKQNIQRSPEGWLDATFKLRETFKDVYITHLLFQDVYSYKTFGRTKLAKLVMYAKQVGAQKLIDEISREAKPLVERIIHTYAIDAFAYIPPTVPRPLQFMDEFISQLHLSLPEIKLVKMIPGDIPIPQKTLSTLEERVINARESIYLRDTTETTYKNILLIDDVVGSGASFHETAKKLKNSNIGYKNIIAFGLVGNIKGYDVIREM